MKKITIAIITLVTLFSISTAFAYNTPAPGSNDPNAGSNDPSKTSTNGTVQISNPLGDSTDSLQKFIGKLINGLLGIIGSLALVMFVYGGFSWMTSMGNPAAIKKGRDTMLWAAVGLAIIFSAYTLTSFVITSVGAQ